LKYQKNNYFDSNKLIPASCYFEKDSKESDFIQLKDFYNNDPILVED
jgi:hypothetical protein